MYSRNLQALLNHLISEEGVQIDLDDEITGAICVTHAGDVGTGHDPKPPRPASSEPKSSRRERDQRMTATLLVGIYVFVLAMFVGFEVITKVPPTLHTPLMSGANAISGISDRRRAGDRRERRLRAS